MTLTHIDFEVVQRSKSGCSVKTSAYIMCGPLAKDDGTAYNFSRKRRELAHTEILLPDGAPDRFRNPAILWNAAEAADTRINSQTARQILLTIPRECPQHLRVDLARAVAERWRQQGMAVQFAVHCPRAADKEEQPHIHYQLTMRAVGSTGLAVGNKNRAWHDQFREQKGRMERQRICDDANTFFAQRDLQIQIDPRTLAEQGINRPPEPDAPRSAWEAWKREGADETQAPPPVKRVLRHRKLRKELADIDELKPKLDKAISQYEQAISLARRDEKMAAQRTGQPNGEKPKMTKWNESIGGYSKLSPDGKFLANTAYAKFAKDEPGKAVGMDIKAFVEQRQKEIAKTKSEETKMPGKPNKNSPQKRDSKFPPEPWMLQQGGVDALSKAHLESAQKSYDKWKAGLKEDPVRTFDFSSYVLYVQKKVAQFGLTDLSTENKQSDADQKPRDHTVSPRSDDVKLRERVSYVHKLLSERYAVPDELVDFVKRLDVNKESGEATLTLKSGGKIIDTGDLLRTIDEQITADIAAATVAAAHARGWGSLTVTGANDYRTAIAKAAALHIPPISTDVELSPEVQQEIQAALVARAKAALKDAGNTVAPVANSVSPAAGQPNLSADQAKAIAKLDRQQAVEQAELAGEPKALTDHAAIIAPRIADVDAAIKAARLAAQEARLAVDDHAREFPRVRRLLDAGARTRHAALEKEAARLEKMADKLEKGRDSTVNRITKEGRKEAKSAQDAHNSWRYQPTVRRGIQNLADIEKLSAAVAAGDPQILADINAGKLNDAVSKLPQFEQSQIQKARAARTPEQVRGQAIDTAMAEVAKNERKPDRKQAAEEAMRAAVGGDAATIAALDSGKIDEALKAAAVWRKKLDEEAAKIKKAQQDKEALERRMAPPQQVTVAQP